MILQLCLNLTTCIPSLLVMKLSYAFLSHHSTTDTHCTELECIIITSPIQVVDFHTNQIERVYNLIFRSKFCNQDVHIYYMV